MKKYIFSSLTIFLLLVFWGCEKDFDGVVDSQNTTYKVSNINSFSTFIYVQGDSSLPLRVTFLNDAGISAVYADVYASDGNKLNSSPVNLLDNGLFSNGDVQANDNIYSALFPLSQTNPNGNYTIKYFITDEKSITLQIAVHSFEYDNGQANVAPVLSNLVMADSLSAGETIVFTVDVDDENGLSDIKSVFYEAYNPEGVKVENSQGISKFPLFDNQENGDATAGDGTYSVLLTFPVTAQKGTWRFEFQAQDRRNVLSNKIIHNIVVK